MVFEAMLRVCALLQAPAIASGSTEMASVYYLSKYISKGSSDDKRKYATWKFHRQVLANFMWTCIQMQHMKHTFTICVIDSGLTCMTFAANRKWLEITESQRHKHDVGQSVEDCQDIAAKLFHAKLQQPKNEMGSTDFPDDHSERANFQRMLRELVLGHMVHNDCSGPNGKYCPCYDEKKKGCRGYYPKPHVGGLCR